jgi:hypothetical protein
MQKGTGHRWLRKSRSSGFVIFIPIELRNSIEIFSTNLDLIKEMPLESDRAQILSPLILKFKNTFSKIHRDYLQDP